MCKPEDKPKDEPGWHRQTQTTRQRRPGWDQDRPRREATVRAWKAQHGTFCPGCGAIDYYPDGERVVLSADHLEVGNEFGPLGVLCLRCQRKQGSRIARERKRQ